MQTARQLGKAFMMVIHRKEQTHLSEILEITILLRKLRIQNITQCVFIGFWMKDKIL